MFKDCLRALFLTIRNFEERTVIGEMKRDEVQVGAASVMSVDVQHHPVKPGLKFERLDALRRIVFQRDVCADKCLLYDVFGILWAAGQTTRKGVEAVLVA